MLNKTLKFFKIILDVVPCWNKIILGLSTDGYHSLTSGHGSVLPWYDLQDFLLEQNITTHVPESTMTPVPECRQEERTCRPVAVLRWLQHPAVQNIASDGGQLPWDLDIPRARHGRHRHPTTNGHIRAECERHRDAMTPADWSSDAVNSNSNSRIPPQLFLSNQKWF